MEPEVAFGLVLRELRKRKGLSQEKLAHEAEIERNYVSLLELGRNSASINMIFKLSRVLGISVTVFMATVEEKMASGVGHGVSGLSSPRGEE